MIDNCNLARFGDVCEMIIFTTDELYAGDAVNMLQQGSDVEGAHGKVMDALMVQVRLDTYLFHVRGTTVAVNHFMSSNVNRGLSCLDQ